MFKKSLTTIIASTIILTSGCTKVISSASSEFIDGEVISQYGTIPTIVKTGIRADNLEDKYQSYGLVVQTSRGVYNIQVDVLDNCGSSGSHTAYNLAGTITSGTKIRFPTIVSGTNSENSPAGFSKDRIGMLDPDDIEILNASESTQKLP